MTGEILILNISAWDVPKKNGRAKAQGHKDQRQKRVKQ